MQTKKLVLFEHNIKNSADGRIFASMKGVIFWV